MKVTINSHICLLAAYMYNNYAIHRYKKRTCNCMTGLGDRGVNKGIFWGVATPICRQRRLLSNQSSDKVNFPRIPTSTSTNGLLQIFRQTEFLLQICQQGKFWVGPPQPTMATPLLGETCLHLASIIFFAEAAVLLVEKQIVAQEAAYWNLPSVNFIIIIF